MLEWNKKETAVKHQDLELYSAPQQRDKTTTEYVNNFSDENKKLAVLNILTNPADKKEAEKVIKDLPPHTLDWLKESVTILKENLGLQDKATLNFIKKVWENPSYQKVIWVVEPHKALIYYTSKEGDFTLDTEIEKKSIQIQQAEKEAQQAEKEAQQAEKEAQQAEKYKAIQDILIASSSIETTIKQNPQLKEKFSYFKQLIENSELSTLITQQTQEYSTHWLRAKDVINVATIQFLQLQAQKWDSKAAELLSYFETPEITTWVESLKSLFPTLEENLADLASSTWLSDSFDQKTQEFAKYWRWIEGYKLSTITFNESARRKFFDLFKDDIKKSFEHNFPDDDFANFEKWIQDPTSIQDEQKQEYYQRLFNAVVDHIQLGLQTSLNQNMRTDALKAQRDLITQIFDFPIQTLHWPINLASQLKFEKWGIKVQDWLKVEAQLQIDDMPLEFKITPQWEILVTDFVHTPEGYQKYSAYQKWLERLNDAFEIPSLAQLLKAQNMDISEIIMQSKSAKDLQERLREQAKEAIKQKIRQHNLDQQKPIIEAEVNYEVKKQQTLWNLMKFYQPPYEKSLFESGQLITAENPRTARVFELQKAFDITLRERPLELQRLWLQTQRPEIQYLLRESRLAGETWTWGDKFGTVDLLKVLWILPNDSEDWWENPTMEDVQEWISADKLRQVADMLSKAKNNPSLLPPLPQGFKWDLNGKFPRVVRKE